jgi:hypothetical protein
MKSMIDSFIFLQMPHELNTHWERLLFVFADYNVANVCCCPCHHKRVRGRNVTSASACALNSNLQVSQKSHYIHAHPHWWQQSAVSTKESEQTKEQYTKLSLMSAVLTRVLSLKRVLCVHTRNALCMKNFIVNHSSLHCSTLLLLLQCRLCAQFSK